MNSLIRCYQRRSVSPRQCNDDTIGWISVKCSRQQRAPYRVNSGKWLYDDVRIPRRALEPFGYLEWYTQFSQANFDRDFPY